MLKIPAFWVVLFLTALSWTTWYMVLTNISPNESVGLAYTTFYISLFFSTTFTFGIIFSLVWKIFKPTSSHYSCLKTGIREGILTGLAVTCMLMVMKYASLSLGAGLLLVIFFVLLEMIFLRISSSC